MKTSTFSAIFELDPKHTVEFLTNFYFLKTFLDVNAPEELAELFDSEQDKIGFLKYGLPYVKYLKNLSNVVQSVKAYTTLQQDRARRTKKTYKPVLTGKELSAPETEQLEIKIFRRRLLYPNQSDTTGQETYAPWYVYDALYGHVLQFIEESPFTYEDLTSEDLELLVSHIITYANEFRPVEIDMDLLEYASRGFEGKQNLQIPFPLSRHLSFSRVTQGGNHASIKFPDMYKEWEYRVMESIYIRIEDHFRQNLSEYQLRVIAGYVAVLIGIFKTKEQFEVKNEAGSWREYLAKNVKYHISKAQKAKENESDEDNYEWIIV